MTSEVEGIQPDPGAPHALLDAERHALVLEDVRGSMFDGYDDDRVNAVLARLNAAFGIRLVCVWNALDTFGFHGHSDFYLETPEGRLHHVAGSLWGWLNHAPEDDGAPDEAGTPASWWGRITEMSMKEMTKDGCLNYAIRDLRDA